MSDHGKETGDFVKANGPGYMRGGLRLKYNITKSSGRPVDPAAIYFVLRLDKDPHARKAVRVYAESVKSDNITLSRDLLRQVKLCEIASGE